MTFESTKPRFIVVDPESNAIVLEENADERVHPASLTKLYSLLIAMEARSHTETKFGTEITIPRNLELSGLITRVIPGQSYPTNEIFSRTGDSSDVRTTLALAHHLSKDEIYNWGDGSHLEKEARFLAYANARLKEIGLTDTNMTVIAGENDSEHYTTLKDIAVAMDYMHTNFPRSTQIALSGTTRGVHSSLMLRGEKEAEWGKTGWLTATGYSHAAYVERDGKPLIVIMTGQERGARSRRSAHAVHATRELLDKAYEIVNAPDYNPEAFYEDVTYDRSAPLPATPQIEDTLSDDFNLKNIKPRPRPFKYLTFEGCDDPNNPPFTMNENDEEQSTTPSNNGQEPQTDEEMFQAVNNQLLFEKIVEEEGYFNGAYKDELGKLTIGIGHLLNTDADDALLGDAEIREKDRISDLCVHRLYELDSEKAIRAAISQARDIGRFQQDFITGLVSVNFQLGENWPKDWPKAYEYMKEGDYANAMVEIVSASSGRELSGWAHQTPYRMINFLKVLAQESKEDQLSTTHEDLAPTPREPMPLVSRGIINP